MAQYARVATTEPSDDASDVGDPGPVEATEEAEADDMVQDMLRCASNMTVPSALLRAIKERGPRPSPVIERWAELGSVPTNALRRAINDAIDSAQTSRLDLVRYIVTAYNMHADPSAAAGNVAPCIPFGKMVLQMAHHDGETLSDDDYMQVLPNTSLYPTPVAWAWTYCRLSPYLGLASLFFYVLLFSVFAVEAMAAMPSLTWTCLGTTIAFLGVANTGAAFVAARWLYKSGWYPPSQQHAMLVLPPFPEGKAVLQWTLRGTSTMRGVWNASGLQGGANPAGMFEHVATVAAFVLYILVFIAMLTTGIGIGILVTVVVVHVVRAPPTRRPPPSAAILDGVGPDAGAVVTHTALYGSHEVRTALYDAAYATIAEHFRSVNVVVCVHKHAAPLATVVAGLFGARLMFAYEDESDHLSAQSSPQTAVIIGYEHVSLQQVIQQAEMLRAYCLVPLMAVYIKHASEAAREEPHTTPRLLRLRMRTLLCKGDCIACTV